MHAIAYIYTDMGKPLKLLQAVKKKINEVHMAYTTTCRFDSIARFEAKYLKTIGDAVVSKI